MTLAAALGRCGPDVRWSAAIETSDGHVETVEPDRLLRTASVAKVFLLVEVAARLEAGELCEEQALSRLAVDPVADSGVWQHLSVDELPLRDVAALVGMASDNWATNVLLDLVGLPAVTSRAEALAPGGSRLLDAVRDHRGPGHPETLSVGCAADWVSVMRRLRAGELVSPAVSARVLDWLAPSVDLSMVAGALGLDPLAHARPDRGWSLWSKTGTDDGVRADVGWVDGPGRGAAYAVICEWDPARADPELGDPRDEVLAAMRDVGRHLRELCG